MHFVYTAGVVLNECDESSSSAATAVVASSAEVSAGAEADAAPALPASVKAGFGVYWNKSSRLNVGAPLLFGPATANRVHLAATNHALQCALSYDMRQVVIKTPSDYVLDCFHGVLPRYKAVKFRREDKTPLANRDLLIQMDSLVQAIRSAGHEVTVRKIHPGRSGDMPNAFHAAHKLAEEGSTAYTFPR